MKIYIRSAASISPQKTFGAQTLPDELVEHTGNKLACIEPDYNKIIDPKLIRRMSRIIKMGVAAATSCLQQAAVDVPDAIITGTAYGCLEDTEIFLRRMVENKEEMLTPTAFIQSTHNTVGAQIALMLKCHQYNNTFVHRGFSFESALLDAIMLLHEGKASHVLAGAVDEIIPASHAILSRLGLYRQKTISNFNLLHPASKGTMAGEGAAFFSLTNQAAGNIAELKAVHTFYKPQSIAEIEKNIFSFLKHHSIDIKNIDLIITGRNGDQKSDDIYDRLDGSVFNDNRIVHYKHLCGEYPTATAFALWIATGIIKQQALPSWLSGEVVTAPIKNILIYNHSNNIHHSLSLVSAC